MSLSLHEQMMAAHHRLDLAAQDPWNDAAERSKRFLHDRKRQFAVRVSVTNALPG
jgi:hypothetical protein